MALMHWKMHLLILRRISAAYTMEIQHSPKRHSRPTVTFGHKRIGRSTILTALTMCLGEEAL